MARDINACTFTGRLAANAEVKTFDSGWNAITFRIAVNDSVKTQDGGYEDVADWHNVKLLRKSDRVAEWLTKGKKITVSGRYKVDEYEKAGEKKRWHYLLADNLDLGSRNDGAGQTSATSSAGPDDDIPFASADARHDFAVWQPGDRAL